MPGKQKRKLNKFVNMYTYLSKTHNSRFFCAFFIFSFRFRNIKKLTWDFVNSIYSHKYPNILMLVDLVLALPACSAEAERGFSQMKRTRSHLNAKVEAERMTDILVIQLNSPDINNFDPKKAIHLWNTRTSFAMSDPGPNSNCSSNSESQDESDG